MSSASEQPRKRAIYGPAASWVGLLGVILACALLQRSTGEPVSSRLLLVSAVVLLCSVLAGASAVYALVRRESSRAFAFFGFYFSLAGVLYVVRELLV